VRRNSLILFVVLLVLATLGWAGWANFEYRKQTAEQRMATMAQGELIADTNSASPQLLSPLIGKPASAFTLEDLNGKKVSLTDYKGRALMINFWATWCAPCKIETPWIIELRNKYSGQGFEVLGISADDLDRDDKQKLADDKQAIRRAATQLHIPYPILFDGDSISTLYGGLDSLPTSYFIDRKGKIVAAQLGLTSKDEMEKNIQKALAEASTR